MKQTASIISTYTADAMGVCSALFELGGMTVMHDASGCNSTYNTHDEPRWYDMDSLVFISGLSEMEAIMGDDSKLVEDMVLAARDLHPAFIALAGTPIPMMTGMDLRAIAQLVEQRTGIPGFGFDTNGMHSYLAGASAAWLALARRFLADNCEKEARTVNILGATPLDFSVNGSVDSLRRWLREQGWQVGATWAMGSTLDELKLSGRAAVNLVVSWSGLALARFLQERCGTPYVAGLPMGKACGAQVQAALTAAAADGQSRTAYTGREDTAAADTVIIGESVAAGSLAAALTLEQGRSVRVLCPLETEASLLNAGDAVAPDEDDIIPRLAGVRTLIADPLYKPIFRGERFIPWPHEGFSGRIFRQQIPDLTFALDKAFVI
ncbi:MAG: oxidoreductase [Firmicutes bacterium]|nr:oxidoreductase [Bacillota bacterium]